MLFRLLPWPPLLHILMLLWGRIESAAQRFIAAFRHLFRKWFFRRSVSHMHKVQFIGRIIPSAVKFSMAMPDLVWKWEEEGLDIKIRIKIGNSIVNAECEVERYSQDYVQEFYKRACKRR